MSSDGWQRLKQLFEQAVELDPSARAQLLDKIATEDADLHRELQALLASDDQAEDYLEEPVAPPTEILSGAITNKPAPSPEPGDMVGHFKIMRLLRRGGMAEVFLARDTQLGRKVALKMVTTKMLGPQDLASQFLAEARTTAKFNHPNIVTIHAVGEHDSRPYVALEYLEGQDLGERLSERRLNLQEALRISLAIAEGLAEAHSHGVLHRDLKPGNVFIPRDGRIRVVDFGLALTVAKKIESVADEDEAADCITPKSPWLMGTPGYMAPEQWRQEQCGEATDIWALGIIIFEMCAGWRPFDELKPVSSATPTKPLSTKLQLPSDTTASTPPSPITPVAKMFDRLSRQKTRVCGPETPPVLADVAEVSQALSKLVTRCLTKDAAERPSAAEVADEIREQLNLEQRGQDSDLSPFRGLLPFAESHAHFFFGRDSEISAFVERVRLQPVLPVMGSSGSGKTSFVQAGVIPRLREQADWIVLQLRPGSRPFEVLSGRLSRRDSAMIHQLPDTSDSFDAIDDHISIDEMDDSILAQQLFETPRRLSLELRAIAEEQRCKVLLYVDQLEELFTLVDDNRVRARFMEAICTAADDPIDPVRVVFTARDDFLGRLATGPEAREVLSRVTVIQAVDPTMLEQVLVRPARAVGYRFEDDDLPREMATAVAGEPACLPLLQFAAQQLWEQADKKERVLQRSTYHAMGGVAGALAKHADGVLEGFSPEELVLARELLLRMVTGEKTRRVVRRRVALEGLGDEAAHVLGRLTQARLVTIRKSRSEDKAEAKLELAHESLISTWHSLTRWVDESADEIAFLREVGQAAELWSKRGKRPEELWRGDALRDGLRTLERCRHKVPEDVSEFLHAGSTAEIQRVRRRRTLWLTAVIVLGAMVLIFAWQKSVADQQRTIAEKRRGEAVKQRHRAERQRAEALREGARAALGQSRMLEARAKARMALEIQDDETARALWWQLSDQPLLWRKQLGTYVYGVAFSPEKSKTKTLAAACGDGAVHLFDVATKSVRLLRGPRDRIFTVAFSTDGRFLASGGWGGEVKLWNVATGTTAQVFKGHEAGVYGVAFSPDGQWLASASTDKTVRLWNVTEGTQKHVFEQHADGVLAIRFNPRGRELASAGIDGTIRLFDFNEGTLLRELSGHTGPVRSVAYSPDGQLLASASNDKTVRIWNPADGRQQRLLAAHQDKVLGIAFSPDGQRLASCSQDKKIRLWNVNTGALERQLDGHDGNVWSVDFSPDGNMLASGGFDYSVRVWDLQATVSDAQHTTGGHQSSVYGIAFSPNGQWLASGGNDRKLLLWDARSGRVKRKIEGFGGRVTGVHFSPNGKLLATGSHDKSIRLWEVATGTEQAYLAGHREAVSDVKFSPDGQLLASSCYDNSIKLWNVAEAKEHLTLNGHTRTVFGVNFGPDGSLVSCGADGTARLWDPESGREKRRFTHHQGTVYGAAISPDGKLLASGGVDKTVQLVALNDNAEARSTILGRHSGRIYQVAIDPRGQWVAATCSDGKVHLWELRGKRHLELRGAEGDPNYVVFSPNSRWVASGADDGSVRVWETATGRPFWRCPALLSSPPRLLSHLGWSRLDPFGANSKQATALTARQIDELLKTKAIRAVEAGGKNQRWLCIKTANAVQLWDLAADQRLATHEVAKLQQIVGFEGGCLAKSSDAAFTLRPSGATDLDFEGLPTAIGWAPALAPSATGIFRNGAILVATAGQVFAFSPEGAVLARFRSGYNATAITRASAQAIAIGYHDGSIELVAPERSRAGLTPGLSFEAVPYSPPERIVAGPTNTIVVGYADGTLGLWNLNDGTRLAYSRLHGRVQHILIEKGRLYAATDLGSHVVWDLSTFDQPYCQLLRQVWQRVPVIWSSGRAMVRPPMAGHQCAEKNVNAAPASSP